MDFVERHELRKIDGKQDEYEIVVYLNNFSVEFGGELGKSPKNQTNVVEFAKEMVEKRYPKLKVTMVKLMIGGMAVTSIPLMGANASAVEASTADTTPQTTQVSQADSAFYQVKAGETLWGIARQFDTSVDLIKRANNLTSDGVRANQQLLIPKTFHTVDSGDYLTVLAKKYGTSVEAIKVANGLTSDITQVGQTLIIPANLASQGTSPTATNQTPTEAKTTSYTVVPRDSLSAIAKRFGTSVEAVKSVNNLSSDVIRVGQTLTIPREASATPPGTSTQATTHTVSTGDSLWAIANKYNVTVDGLRSANNLSSNVLSIGQTLTIPGENQSSTQNKEIPTTSNSQYTVKSGDSLWGISSKHNVSVDALRSTNNLDSDRLQIGQTLVIPKGESGVTSPAVTPAQNTTSYTVTSGDTLSRIAKKYNTTVQQIKSTNNLTGDTIRLGQVLTVPAVVGQASDSTTEQAPSATAGLTDVQKSLQILGYAVPAMSGSYDSATTQALKKFQADYGLSVTGEVNEATKTAIDRAIVKDALVKDTKNYLGVPYLWGGTTPSGFDCSGFVYYMFNQHGVDMSRTTSASLYNQGTTISNANLQPGDLVFFAVNSPNTISHVGFYMGDNQWISATSSKGIAIYSMDNSYWSKYYVGAKRVF
ncbi:C40 family peptidase [Oceanobacillus halotolerans]|uniref:C40 family peptidase n=1 Tax=Oceanobacillus halotolerans TaxID=2663380 RepID=UPI0013DA4DB7|nr:LysM peptidoglycan-binding domain-containing protein [Oceanobacillus halotolerans]